MKKLIFSAALMAALFTSCKKEPIVKDQDELKVQIKCVECEFKFEYGTQAGTFYVDQTMSPDQSIVMLRVEKGAVLKFHTFKTKGYSTSVEVFDTGGSRAYKRSPSSDVLNTWFYGEIILR